MFVLRRDSLDGRVASYICTQFPFNSRLDERGVTLVPSVCFIWYFPGAEWDECGKWIVLKFEANICLYV